jgi:hypothetical protein
MTASEDSTLPPRSLSSTGGSLGVRSVPALVLVWSREEPSRAGEVLLLPPQGREPWTFGREGAGGAAGERTARLVRQRPGVNKATGPVDNRRISRTQLVLRPAEGGPLAVENAGRCPMIHGGREVSGAELRPGDLVELRHEMVFLCARRPEVLPAAEGVPLHPFGEADSLGLVGESPALWALRAAVFAAARRSGHVLVLGESGTGKELVARALHACSPRASRAFVARSAATLPEGVLDAELFGSARGFPHAGSPERPGLVGEADGGTLLLDEIGELPEALQAHLLRVLDGGEYHRLGEARARTADLRLIGATNRPESAIKHDVLARLTIRILIPGLDARREDVPLLVRHLLRKHAAGDAELRARIYPDGDVGAAPRVAPELIGALVGHGYTTHLRELDALLVASTLEGRGRYAGVTAGVRRLLGGSQGAVPSDAARSSRGAAGATGAPLSSGAGSARGERALGAASRAFTAEEERRLGLLRMHGFRPSACARDPKYGANRQSADFHLRQLMAKALAIHGYRVGAAEELLAGADPLLRERVQERMTRFLENLGERLGEEGRERLSRSLTEEWRGAAGVALDLLAAVADGRVR